MTSYTVAILTSSDRSYRHEREDLSGPKIQEIVEEANYIVTDTAVLPDEQERLSKQLMLWCDQCTIDLILTTGGTGFAPRDCMPEATLAVLDRSTPGIAEAIRAYSMAITPRAMLSRSVAGIRKKTLIINLPGSPKAVEESLRFVLPQLPHGLDILHGKGDH